VECLVEFLTNRQSIRFSLFGFEPTPNKALASAVQSMFD